MVARVSSLILASQSALPHQGEKRKAGLDGLLQIVVVLRVVGVRLAEGQRLVVHGLLNFDEQTFDRSVE